MATRDDRIPLSKPITLRSGKEVDYVNIKKGQQILIPVLSIHKDKDIWGEDAEEFRPDRWLDGVPEALAANKGASVYSYLYVLGSHWSAVSRCLIIKLPITFDQINLRRRAQSMYW